MLGGAGFFDTVARDLDRIAVRGSHFVLGIQGGTWIRRESLHPCALTDDAQLVDSTRTLQVTGHQHWGVALGFQVFGELTGQGGFTGTLQTRQHNHGRRVFRQVQAPSLAAEDVLELLIDDFDDLLRRVQSLRDFCADGAFFNALDKAAHNGERNVGFQQRQPDFAGGGVNISLSQFALAAKPFQGGL